MEKKKKFVDDGRKIHVSLEALTEKIAYRVRYQEYDYKKLAWIYRELFPKVRSCQWLEREKLFVIEEGKPLTEEQKRARIAKEQRVNSR